MHHDKKKDFAKLGHTKLHKLKKIYVIFYNNIKINFLKILFKDLFL